MPKKKADVLLENFQSSIVRETLENSEFLTEGKPLITGHVLSKVWENLVKPIRCYTRQIIKYFFLEGCLYNNKDRDNLIKKRVFFESTPGESNSDHKRAN